MGKGRGRDGEIVVCVESSFGVQWASAQRRLRESSAVRRQCIGIAWIGGRYSSSLWPLRDRRDLKIRRNEKVRPYFQVHRSKSLGEESLWELPLLEKTGRERRLR